MWTSLYAITWTVSYGDDRSAGSINADSITAVYGNIERHSENQASETRKAPDLEVSQPLNKQGDCSTKPLETNKGTSHRSLT